jgi:glutamine amidotransferase
MSVAIVDYGSGNLHSAHKAVERAAAQEGVQVIVTSDPDVVRRADRIVLPGVGAFADCRRGLDNVAGMVDVLEECVIKGGKPFLGICVGMQLLASRGLEHGIAHGLNWIPGEVVEIKPTSPDLKVPHMGWNTLAPRREHALLKDIPVGENGLHAYFVHSYHLRAADPAHVVATTEYGGELTAMVGRDNIAGTQFHPEKSQKLGLALIANFLRWTP